MNGAENEGNIHNKAFNDGESLRWKTSTKINIIFKRFEVMFTFTVIKREVKKSNFSGSQNVEKRWNLVWSNENW